MKIKVDQPMAISAVRFYKASQETGVHIGRIWTASGVELAQTTFTGETASGWQHQALPAPLTLQPETVYIVSVNVNAFWSLTANALAAEVASGPLRSVVDGRNGVFGARVGQSSRTRQLERRTTSSTSRSCPPGLSAPLDGRLRRRLQADATGVARDAAVVATLSRPTRAHATVTPATFTLSGPGPARSPAPISYDVDHADRHG